LSRHLTLIAEGSYARAENDQTLTPERQLSEFVGAVFERGRLTIHTNFIRQGTSYLPAVGYSLGDRIGWFTESRYRLDGPVEVYGSVSDYGNNIEKRPDVPTLHSTGYTAGAAVLVRRKVSVSGSMAVMHFDEERASISSALTTQNQQSTLTVTVPMGRHSVRGSLTELHSWFDDRRQQQRLFEVGDAFTWKRLSIGGAVRTQHSLSAERRNTYFLRGSLSASLKRLSAYGYFEHGSDVVNRSVFSTSAFSSTVVGLSSPLLQGWSMRLEAYRNTLNTVINPENIFLFGPSGFGPNTSLSESRQWSMFFELRRQLQWGARFNSATSTIQQFAAAQIPLVGTVRGIVLETSGKGARGAANVAVGLDGSHYVLTDNSGQYEFTRVPEGPHDVAIDLEQLPADLDPGTATAKRVAVSSRGVAQADFDVVQLTSFGGQVTSPATCPVESLVIRLGRTERYTTPRTDGTFTFANLTEGTYEVRVDRETLPAGCEMASLSDVSVQAAHADPAPPVTFTVQETVPVPKPVRQIPQPEIHISDRRQIQ
jgi:hypothetical protein